MTTLDHRALGAQLQKLLATPLFPIGIAFTSKPPPGVERLAAAEPASCSYWKLAAQGQVFYTDAEQHQGCPIGAHTHGVPLTPEKGAELQQMAGTMIGLGYLRAEEIPQIPHRAPGSFRFASYGPLSQLPFEPEVILVRGGARAQMLVVEAVTLLGLGGALHTMGRPTCAALPLALESGKPTFSLGCIGNRVYTGLGDDESYAALPASALAPLVAQLSTVLRANAELEKFHRARA